MNKQEKITSDYTLTELIIKSTTFKDSLTDPILHKRIQIITTAIKYILKSDKTQYLKHELQKSQLNDSLDQWVTEFTNLSQKIKDLYTQLEKEHKTTLRGQYPGIIAEIIYNQDKNKWNKLNIQ